MDSRAFEFFYFFLFGGGGGGGGGGGEGIACVLQLHHSIQFGVFF